MEGRILKKETLEEFRLYLKKEEKSPVTIEKYLRDVRAFFLYMNGREVTKEEVLGYKSELLGSYAARSVNSKLSSVSSLFTFLGWTDCKVRSLKIQRQIFQSEDRELSKEEYVRLLKAAENRPRLRLILETICGTGIRVSELQYFTVEEVRKGTVTVSCKNKTRNIFVPGKLQKKILDYARRNQIGKGIVFRTSSGKAVNRSNIWAEMKRLCTAAKINPKKVFPHNLRKLFARTFYHLEKDIAKLADLLGHSSIETTRIYIMTTGTEHRRKIERMGLII